MKCIVCDRCKKIIEDTKRCKVVTCSKPLKIDWQNERTQSGQSARPERSLKENIWEKELCSDCAELLDEFMDGADSDKATTPDVEPDAGVDG